MILIRVCITPLTAVRFATLSSRMTELTYTPARGTRIFPPTFNRPWSGNLIDPVARR